MAGSCSDKGPDKGGLMLLITEDGPLNLDELDVRVTASDKVLLENTYHVPDEAKLPTTLAIVSNGNQAATVNIHVVGWRGKDALDVRDAIVSQVPVDRVSELRVVLSARCSSRTSVSKGVASTTCGDGSGDQTCDPTTGNCVSSNVDASQLDEYHSGDELKSAGASGEGGQSSVTVGDAGRPTGGAMSTSMAGEPATAGMSGGPPGAGGEGGLPTMSSSGGAGGEGGSGQQEPVVPLIPGVPSTVVTLDASVANELEAQDLVKGALATPTAIAFLPNGDAVITEKGGKIWVLDTTGVLHGAGVLSVNTASEQGVLGLVVAPDFETSHKLFIHYSRSDASGGSNNDRGVVASVTLINDVIDAPVPIVSGLLGPANSVGGALTLSADGKQLFVAVGDTGMNTSAGPGLNISNYYPTCLTNPNGKILRVNLDGSIPADNPLVGVSMVTACGATPQTAPSSLAAPRKDIYAWGLRNPWTMWLDPKTQNLWVSDCGEITNEEINVVTAAGQHFGFPWREGDQGVTPQCSGVTPSGPCIEPAYTCRASGAGTAGCRTIIGGAIVDSCHFPADLRGRYYFGDLTRNYNGSLAVNAARSGVVGTHSVVATLNQPTRFALGPEGSLYVLSQANGSVSRIQPKVPAPCN